MLFLLISAKPCLLLRLVNQVKGCCDVTVGILRIAEVQEMYYMGSVVQCELDQKNPVLVMPAQNLFWIASQ